MEENPNNVVPPEPKASKTTNIPKADVDFMDVSMKIEESWRNNPQITLMWITQPEFKALVANYSESLKIRKTTGNLRPQLTGNLLAISKEIDAKIENVKDYLVDKFDKKTAPSYFPEFGIVKNNRTYKLPSDQNRRNAALGQLVQAITTHGLQDKTYGLAYWSDIKTKYSSLLQKTDVVDSTVSKNVGDKTEYKKQIHEVLNALILVVHGNYPQTYKSELRAWGFQKEKY